MNPSYEVLQHQLTETRQLQYLTHQQLIDMTAAWKGACASGNDARIELAALRIEVDKLREIAGATAVLALTDDFPKDTPAGQMVLAALDGALS